MRPSKAKPHKLYEISLKRSVCAVFVGAASGTILTISYFMAGNLWAGVSIFEGLGATMTLIAPIAFLTWLFGIVVVGAPVWTLLHRLGLSGWITAIMCGYLTPYVALVLINTRALTGHTTGNFSSSIGGKKIWVEGVLTPYGWEQAFLDPVAISIGGCFVGLVIWLVAYRKQ